MSYNNIYNSSSPERFLNIQPEIRSDSHLGSETLGSKGMTMEPSIIIPRILVADDHELVRQGLRMILEKHGFKVVAEAPDGQAAIREALEQQPDVVILDIAMPLMNGIEAAIEISKVLPRTKVVLLTMHSEDQYVLEALRAGIRAYVLKSRAATEVIQAVRDVCEGNIFLSPSVSSAIVRGYLTKTSNGVDTLTAREVQVLRLVAEGKTTKEIASLLGISVKTADTHRTNIMHKLGVHSSAELIHYAVRRGILQL
jgi:DNA-binding NarL/FixJ family response regulator